MFYVLYPFVTFPLILPRSKFRLYGNIGVVYDLYSGGSGSESRPGFWKS
jgi:hypothetical protein